MSKASSLMESLSQFTRNGNTFRSAGKTENILEAGVYNLGADMRGLIFEKVEVKTDALIKMHQSKYKYLTEEIEKFWNSKAKFTEMGFTDKRAFMIHSRPGMGKSCILKQVMEDMTNKKAVTFIATNLSILAECIREFREVEPERKVLVILEELDEMLYSGSKALSDLLDGPTSVGGIFYLGTTNYIDRIPERMLRPSRFDRKVEMGPPDNADRMTYFKAKLGMNEQEADKIQMYADKTEGFSFAALKEFLVSVHCLGNTVEETITRLRGMSESVGMTYGNMDEHVFADAFAKLLAAKKKPIASPNALNESRVSRVMKAFR